MRGSLDGTTFNPPVIRLVTGEVNQQASVYSTGDKICANLCIMILVKGFNRLQFQYHRVLHDEVETVTAHRLVLLKKIDLLFTLDLHAAI